MMTRYSSLVLLGASTTTFTTSVMASETCDADISTLAASSIMGADRSSINLNPDRELTYYGEIDKNKDLKLTADFNWAWDGMADNDKAGWPFNSGMADNAGFCGYAIVCDEVFRDNYNSGLYDTLEIFNFLALNPNDSQEEGADVNWTSPGGKDFRKYCLVTKVCNYGLIRGSNGMHLTAAQLASANTDDWREDYWGADMSSATNEDKVTFYMKFRRDDKFRLAWKNSTSDQPGDWEAVDGRTHQIADVLPDNDYKHLYFITKENWDITWSVCEVDTQPVYLCEKPWESTADRALWSPYRNLISRDDQAEAELMFYYGIVDPNKDQKITANFGWAWDQVDDTTKPNYPKVDAADLPKACGFAIVCTDDWYENFHEATPSFLVLDPHEEDKPEGGRWRWTDDFGIKFREECVLIRSCNDGSLIGAQGMTLTAAQLQSKTYEDWRDDYWGPYYWQGAPGVSQPFNMRFLAGGEFAIAGYNKWTGLIGDFRDVDGHPAHHTYSITKEFKHLYFLSKEHFSISWTVTCKLGSDPGPSMPDPLRSWSDYTQNYGDGDENPVCAKHMNGLVGPCNFFSFCHLTHKTFTQPALAHHCPNTCKSLENEYPRGLCTEYAKSRGLRRKYTWDEATLTLCRKQKVWVLKGDEDSKCPIADMRIRAARVANCKWIWDEMCKAVGSVVEIDKYETLPYPFNV